MLPHRFPRPARLGLYALAAAILLALCVLPSRDLPDPGTGDRFEHFAAWLVLTLTGYALAPNRRLAIPAFALAYGVFIEVLQGVLPSGRHADPLDLLADAQGVATGVVLFLLVRWLGSRRRARA
ncbi:VanZ family protein [uncultured Phenylobacterium sp.]|uniref:VanZ family protein n=1 Tax=uncultured Phenylobacterium sp. TaxID=349273 RepID=UPI0025E7C0AF|nr:VanZ family protein [uncultured Phenylobacterium sp.]